MIVKLWYGRVPEAENFQFNDGSGSDVGTYIIASVNNKLMYPYNTELGIGTKHIPRKQK